MRQKVICTQPRACIRTIEWDKFMSWNKIISWAHYSYNFLGKVIFLRITFFAKFIAEKALYTLLNSIWRDKPQYRMPGRGDLRWWSVWGRLHRYPLPSPPLWPLSLSLGARILITGPGTGISHRGWAERRTLGSSFDKISQAFTDRQWETVFVIVVKSQGTRWIQVGQSRAVYYFGKTETIHTRKRVQ